MGGAIPDFSILYVEVSRAKYKGQIAAQWLFNQCINVYLRSPDEQVGTVQRGHLPLLCDCVLVCLCISFLKEQIKKKKNTSKENLSISVKTI